MKLRSGENPAVWKGNLKSVLPKAKRTGREHHAALRSRELPAFMAEGGADGASVQPAAHQDPSLLHDR